jgi:hypothetical protein
VYLAYNFLFINHILRPGEQISNVVTFPVGAPPAILPPRFRETYFFAHGLNVGLEVRY